MTGFGKQFLIISLVAAFAGAAGYYVSRLTGQGAAPATEAAAKPAGIEGQPVPEVTLKDLDGKAHTLAEYRGKWLLVNFWASWCGPCMEEIPALVAAQNKQTSGGFQVLGIAMDEPDAVRKTIKDKGFNYPTLVGDDEVLAVMEKFGNTMGALPFSVLVSPDGVIRDLELGGLTELRLANWGKLAAGGK